MPILDLSIIESREILETLQEEVNDGKNLTRQQLGAKIDRLKDLIWEEYEESLPKKKPLNVYSVKVEGFAYVEAFDEEDAMHQVQEELDIKLFKAVCSGRSISVETGGDE